MSMSELINKPISILAVHDYEPERLNLAISKTFELLGIEKKDFFKKKIVIKPNLVAKKAPEAAVTTHPAVLASLLEYLSDSGAADVVIAESSGGPYTKQTLDGAYKACGIKTVVEKYGASLNYDTDFVTLETPDGKLVKSFNVIAPIANADVIISLPKLKTHSLTGMSAAVKNYFGVIPGLQKFEMHSRFPDYHDFAAMLCDLAQMLHERARCINILDGIVAMEGNGPTAGDPRPLGCMLASENPFALDFAAQRLIGLKDVMTVDESVRRGLVSKDFDLKNLVGDTFENFITTDFKKPDSKPDGLIALIQKLCGGRLNEFFRPKPCVTERCVGCGECARSCPEHTITMVEHRPSIELSRCIRCFCCQELCPHGAIVVKRNSFIDIINGTSHKK